MKSHNHQNSSSGAPESSGKPVNTWKFVVLVTALIRLVPAPQQLHWPTANACFQAALAIPEQSKLDTQQQGLVLLLLFTYIYFIKCISLPGYSTLLIKVDIKEYRKLSESDTVKRMYRVLSSPGFPKTVLISPPQNIPFSLCFISAIKI